MGPRSVREVYVLAVGMTRFAKHPELGMKALSAQAVAEVFADGAVSARDIDAAWFANAGWGMGTGQHCIRGQVALAPLGIEEVPVMNVENACAGGSSAFHGAFLGIASGAYDVALAIGAEKSFVSNGVGPEAKQRAFDGFIAGTDVEITRPFLEKIREEADAHHRELQAEGKAKGSPGGARSPFMDLYGVAARDHMERYGTTQRQLAVIAAKNHAHGALNPLAQYQQAMTTEEVLQDRVVSWPLTRSMCAPTGDGAAAAVLVAGDRLGAFDAGRAVRVRASVLASGRVGNGPRRYPSPAERAYETAGLGPSDIDIAEVHDATAFGELAWYEHLGFCPQGDGGPYAESGATRLGGARPVNPSGGLECRGHPIAATGLAQIVEIVTQLRHQAGTRQVEGARIALTENGGGFLGQGEAAVAIQILEAP
jgi:acetyl-CoA acetyltransferase